MGDTKGDGISRRDPALPESEAGTGIIPEDESRADGDTHLPASEADSPLIEEEKSGTTQSWPGSGGPGTIPPPG